MSTIRDDRRYTKEHEWALALPEAGIYRVGVTDHAQDQLGDVVFVELPDVGRKVAIAEPVGVVESVKTVSDVYSPLAGTVTRVNTELTGRPELVNHSPYDDGWIYELAVTDLADAELLDAAAYGELIAE